MVGLGGVLEVECAVRGGSRSSPPALERAGELGFPPHPRPGSGHRLGTVSCRAPEPSHGRPQARPRLEAAVNLSPSLPRRPTGGGSHPGSRSTDPARPRLGGLRSLRAGWVLGARLPR